MSLIVDIREHIGPYRLLRPLGVGGGGTVWLAERVYSVEGVEQSRRVAIKEAKISDDEVIRQNDANLRREFLIGVLVQHPNVCGIQDILRVGHRLFIEIEYIPGRNAAEIAQVLGEAGALLPPDAALDLAAQAAAGLHAIHTTIRDGRPLGLVHRDVKPENLMIHEQGIVKVLDLGIVWGATPDTRHTQPHVVRGTPAYMAPEQHLGRDLGPPADIFGLGAVLFELLTGEVLFPEPDQMTLLDIKRRGTGLDRVRHQERALRGAMPVILRCVQPDPAQRYARAEDLETALRDLLRTLQPSPGLAGLMRLLRGEPLTQQGLGRDWASLQAAFSAPRRSISLAEAQSRMEAKARGETSDPIRPGFVERLKPAPRDKLPTEPPRGVTPPAQSRPSPAVAAAVVSSPPTPPAHRGSPPRPASDSRHPLASLAPALSLLALVFVACGGILAILWRERHLSQPCFVDKDGDGLGDAAASDLPWAGCVGAGLSEKSGDCDDADATIFPGAKEQLDGKDNNCDGLTPDNERDADGDNWRADADCDDNNAEVNPAATELPGDNLDQDCDGAELCYTDLDGDGYGAEEARVPGLSCAQPGFTARNGDCNDSQPSLHPGRTEQRNGKDDDCDGVVDEETVAPAPTTPQKLPQPNVPPPPPPSPPVVAKRAPILANKPIATLRKEQRNVTFTVSGYIFDPDHACDSPKIQWKVPQGQEGTYKIDLTFSNVSFEVGRDADSVDYRVLCTVSGSPIALEAPNKQTKFTALR